MVDVWLISGIPGSGKTTVGRLLAARLDRSVFIEGDRLQEFIVSGNVWPGTEPAAEASRQIDLNIRNQCLLARSYAAAGFTPIIDYPVISREGLATYRQALPGLAIHFVVLQLGGVGLWIDNARLAPEATVDAILAGRGRARLDERQA